MQKKKETILEDYGIEDNFADFFRNLDEYSIMIEYLLENDLIGIADNYIYPTKKGWRIIAKLEKKDKKTQA